MIALARQEMGAKSGPARAQEVRANAKATPPSGGGVGAIDERPPAKVRVWGRSAASLRAQVQHLFGPDALEIRRI